MGNKKPLNFDIGLNSLFSNIEPFEEVDKPNEVLSYLKELFPDKNVVAGIMGNIDQETGGTFDYKQKQIGGGKGEGLFQFDYQPMKDSYQNFLNKTEQEDSSKAQIDFMKSAIEGDDFYDMGDGNRKKLKKAFDTGNYAIITGAFSDFFENPGDPQKHKRNKAAKKWLDQLGFLNPLAATEAEASEFKPLNFDIEMPEEPKQEVKPLDFDVAKKEGEFKEEGIVADTINKALTSKIGESLTKIFTGDMGLEEAMKFGDIEWESFKDIPEDLAKASIFGAKFIGKQLGKDVDKMKEFLHDPIPYLQEMISKEPEKDYGKFGADDPEGRDAFLKTVGRVVKPIGRVIEGARAGIGEAIEGKNIDDIMASGVKGFLKPEEVKTITSKIPLQKWELEGDTKLESIVRLTPRAIGEAIETYAIAEMTLGLPSRLKKVKARYAEKDVADYFGQFKKDGIGRESVKEWIASKGGFDRTVIGGDVEQIIDDVVNAAEIKFRQNPQLMAKVVESQKFGKIFMQTLKDRPVGMMIKDVKDKDFAKWFEGSKAIDKAGKPKVFYSGHANVAVYKKFDPKKATAGGFYATDDPEIASNYALGKFGRMEGYTEGSHLKLQGKNKEFNKKLRQVDLTEEHIAKLSEMKANAYKTDKDGYEIDDGSNEVAEYYSWIERSKDYDKQAKQASYQPHNLQNIFNFYESMGYTIAYSKPRTYKTDTGEILPESSTEYAAKKIDEKLPWEKLRDHPDYDKYIDEYNEKYKTSTATSEVERQVKNRFHELLDKLGIEWQDATWAQPGVFPVYLNIQNPIDTSKDLPPLILEELKKAASRERKTGGEHWTKDYPMKDFVKDIEEGNEFWSTQIPTKAKAIFQKFGYDGIKDTGGKGGGQKHEVWVAFEPQQIETAIRKLPEPEQAVEPTDIPIFKGTEEAVKFGKEATPQQIKALEKKREETLAKSKAMRKAEMTDDEMQEAMDLATEGQFYREAIEAKPKEPTPLESEAKHFGYEVKYIDKKPKDYYGKHFDKTKTIEIYTKGRTAEQIQETLEHEIGHVVDYTRRGIVSDPMGDSIKDFEGKLRAMSDSDIYFRYDTMKKEADNIRKEFPKSHSLASTKKEIYADAFRLLKRNPDRLQEIAPTIYKEIYDFYEEKKFKPTEADPLIEEAKKYKTAEEFVGDVLDDKVVKMSQEIISPNNAIKDISDFSGLKVTKNIHPEKPKIIKRGTEEKISYDSSLGSQVDFSDGKHVVETYINETKDQIILSTIGVKEISDLTKTAKGTGLGTKVVESFKNYSDKTGKQFVVPSVTISADKYWEGIPFLEYKYAPIPFEGKMQNVGKSYVYNPEKQQLTDIWNKAQQPPAKPPKKPPVTSGWEEEGWDEEPIEPSKEAQDLYGEFLKETDMEIPDVNLADAVNKIGGIKAYKGGKEFEEHKEIPLKYRKKDGMTLDEAVAEINNQGFNFADGEELRQALISGKDIKKTPPKPKKKPEVDLAVEYEKLKDIWIGEKDVRVHKSKVEKRSLQKELVKASGEGKFNDKVKDLDRAVQIYMDMKRNPAHLDKYYKKLTDEQKRIVDLSQNLPEGIKAIADQIQGAYKKMGLESLEAGVIRNVLDNYAGRIWDLEGKVGGVESFRKFGTKSRHAKQRVFGTIVEGWANDYNLKVEGATNNLQILKEEMIKTIEDKKFIETLKKLKTIDGDPLLTTKHLEGYKQIEHPNFRTWKWIGKAEEGEVYGKNTFIDDEGNLFEKQSLYAPKAQAGNLNNILGISKLKGMPVIDFITKYNAITKAWILQSSFFHHLAFMRSYHLGTGKKKMSELETIGAYQQGMKAIEDSNPLIELAVKNGLTLGIKQDWQEELLQEKTGIGKLLDKWKTSKEVKDKVLDLRQKQADFLFGELGAGLKAKSFLIEYRHALKADPNGNPDDIAKRVANLINDDFGGLHLQRMGRNPTIQHIFRIFALAPDWTESNVRTMIKAFKAGGDAETKLYRRFWANILSKGVAMTILANTLMAAFDEDDKEAKGIIERFIRNYQTAWEAGNLKWTGVDITPLYKGLGGTTEERKYFNILGHFVDPLKFILHPIRSAHHKGSVVYSFFHEAMAGVDWAGKRFTTLGEITGLDKDKGYYKTTRKGKYKKGDPKWGKLKGKTVTWDFGRKGALSYKQLPSFMLSQIKGWQPVQIQNLMAWMAGEMEGFDALANSMGLGVKTTYGRTEKKAKETKEDDLIKNLKKRLKNYKKWKRPKAMIDRLDKRIKRLEKRR